MLSLQERVISALGEDAKSSDEIGAAIGGDADPEAVFLILEHLAANRRAVIVHADKLSEVRFSSADKRDLT